MGSRASRFKPTTYVAPLKPRRPTLPPAQPAASIRSTASSTPTSPRTRSPPPQPLDDAAFARRVYLDLIGLLPAAGGTGRVPRRHGRRQAREARAASCSRDNRAYADHWLTFWNDLLRNDYAGTGYIDGGRKQITAWLYKSLLENKPYDQFARELISPTPDSEGFIKGIKWRGKVNASQVVELQFSQNVGAGVLRREPEVRLVPRQLHRPLEARRRLRPGRRHRRQAARRSIAATSRPARPPGRSSCSPNWARSTPTAPKAKRLEQLAALVTHPDNGRFTRTIVNRLWHRLMGRGIVHPVDVMGNKPWSDDLLDYLAVYLADNGYDLKKLMEHIATSQAYQSQAVPLAKETSATTTSSAGRN